MSMTIGQLASAAHVNVETIRYYERRGLLDRPQREGSRYRRYPAEAAARIRFIKRAQDLGFSLREIAELLELRVHSVEACHAVEAKTREKIAVVESKVRELTRIKEALERLAANCQAREPTSECPILETLDEEASACA